MGLSDRNRRHLVYGPQEITRFEIDQLAAEVWLQVAAAAPEIRRYRLPAKPR